MRNSFRLIIDDRAREGRLLLHPRFCRRLGHCWLLAATLWLVAMLSGYWARFDVSFARLKCLQVAGAYFIAVSRTPPRQHWCVRELWRQYRFFEMARVGGISNRVCAVWHISRPVSISCIEAEGQGKLLYSSYFTT
jgi:hypothetical protein